MSPTADLIPDSTSDPTALRHAEQVYLAALRSRAPSAAVMDIICLPLPPPTLLQGIDRLAAGPVPAAIEAMRSLDPWDPPSDLPSSSPNFLGADGAAGSAGPLRLAMLLAAHERLLLQSSAETSPGELFAGVAAACAKPGWAYPTLGWPFQPAPLLVTIPAPPVLPPPGGWEFHIAATLAEALAGMRVDPALAAPLLSAWRRRRRLLLLVTPPPSAPAALPPAAPHHVWWRALDHWLSRAGRSSRVLLAVAGSFDSGCLPFYLARRFTACTLAPLPAPSHAGEPGADLNSSRSLTTLAAALRDFDHVTRAAAAIILGLFGSDAARRPLLMAMGDPIAGVRVAAIRALGEIVHVAADPSTVAAALIAGLHSFYPEVRANAAYAAAEAVTCAPVPDLIPHLLEALADHDPGVRIAAADALALLSLFSSDLAEMLVPRLSAAAHAPDATLRALALQAVTGVPAAARPLLIAALRDESAAVCIVAATALGRLGPDPAALAALAEAYRANPIAIKGATVEDPHSIPRDTSRVRAAVVTALGELASYHAAAVVAAPILVSALSDPLESVRTAAAVALLTLGRTAAPALLAALTDPDSPPSVRWLSVHLLGAIPDPDAATIGALAGALRDPYSAVRWLAADILSRHADAQARQHLAAARNDRNPIVRTAVEAALRTFPASSSDQGAGTDPAGGPTA